LFSQTSVTISGTKALKSLLLMFLTRSYQLYQLKETCNYTLVDALPFVQWNITVTHISKSTNV